MLHGYNRNSLYPYSTIKELQQKPYIECVDIVEGCLIDNLLLYDHEYHKYYMCMEHAESEWSSCYQIIKDVDNILERWNKFKEEWEELKVVEKH